MNLDLEDLRSTSATTPPAVPRRWVPLNAEQRTVATELQRRAALLRDDSEDGISITEAVALAAIQMGLDA